MEQQILQEEQKTQPSQRSISSLIQNFEQHVQHVQRELHSNRSHSTSRHPTNVISTPTTPTTTQVSSHSSSNASTPSNASPSTPSNSSPSTPSNHSPSTPSTTAPTSHPVLGSSAPSHVTSSPSTHPPRSHPMVLSSAVPSVAAENANDIGTQFYNQKSNDPSIISVRLSNKNVTFVSGWQHNDANKYFDSDPAKKLQYSAKLEHAAYIQITESALGTSANDVTKDFVVDFDGHVDVVTIDTYNELDTLGPNGFSIELWMRLGTTNPTTVFTRGTRTGYIQLNALNLGIVQFVIFTGGGYIFVNSPNNAVTAGRFYHITITGSIKTHVRLFIDGVQVTEQMAGLLSFGTSLPGAGNPLVIGYDPLGLAETDHYCGQIAALNIFKTERTTADVTNSMRIKGANRTDFANCVGRWDFTSAMHLTNYYVTDANEGEDPDPDSIYQGSPAVLPQTAGFDPADVPIRPIVDNNLLYIFRQTTSQKIIADIFQLNGNSLVSVGPSAQVLNTSPCYRGWFTVVKVNNYWVLLNCGSVSSASISTRMEYGDKILWNTFQVNANTFSEVQGFSGMVHPKSSSNQNLCFVTHPTAMYQAGHLLLAVSTNDSARVFIADFTVASDGRLVNPNGDVATPRVGVDFTNVGTTMYASFVTPLGGSPIATNVLPTGYNLDPNGDVRLGTVGSVVRFRHTYFDSKAHIEPPFTCLSGLSYSNGNLAPSQVSTINLNADDPFPISLFRVVNVSNPGNTRFYDGDAIAMQVFIPQADGSAPQLRMVTWELSSPNDYRPGQSCKWVISSEAYTGKVTNPNQVFGVFGVDNNSDDQSNPIPRSGSNMGRVLIAPGIFQNSVNSNFLAPGVSVTSFEQLREEEFKYKNRMGDNGMPIVYIDRFNNPEPLSLYTGYYLCHSEKPTDTNNNRRNFQWAQRKLTSTNYLKKSSINYIDNTTPSLHWWWYSWKVTSFYGGYNLQGGQEILIQGIDPNNDIDFDQPKKWARLTNNKVQQPDEDEETFKYNFWIFKVDQWDNTAKVLTLDTIHVNDWVLLWPRTDNWLTKFARRPLPTPADLAEAIRQFGSGPDSTFQPFQLQYSQASSLPGVSDVALENAKVKDLTTVELSTAVSGLRVGLLNFVRTVAVPTLCTIPNSTAIRMTFRGNGHALKLSSNLIEISDDKDANNNNFYQEGCTAQALMTPGLFYRVDYYPPTGSNQGVVRDMNRVDNVHSFEFPKAIPGFIWTLPPPFKVTGITEVIGQYAHQGWSLDFLHKVIRSVVGAGTFHEGIWKPCLSIPISSDDLHNIRIRTQQLITQRISDKIPNWEHPDTAVRDAAPQESYYTLADIVTSNALANTDEWRGKVNLTQLNTTYNQISNSAWYLNELKQAVNTVADPAFRNNASKYAAYGGIASLMSASLTSTAFLNQLVLMDPKDMGAILKTQIYILSVLDPAAAANVTSVITAALIADQVINDPASVLSNLTDDQLREAYSYAITAACTGRDENSIIIVQHLQDWMAMGTSTDLGNALTAAGNSIDEVRNILNANNAKVVNRLIADKAYNNVSTVSEGTTLLSTVAAMYTIVVLAHPDTPENKAKLAGTIIGAFSGMLETSRMVFQVCKFFKLSYDGIKYTGRATSIVDAAKEGAQSLQMASETIATMSKTLTKFFAFLGVCADAIAFGLAVAKLVNDIKGGSDAETIGIDAAGAVVAAAGVVAALGMMAGAAFAGPLAGAVFVASVVLLIVDECHQKELREKQEEEARKQEELHQQWVAWSRHIMDHHHFLNPT